MENKEMTRREFLKTTTVGVGALSLGTTALSQKRVLGANDRIGVGVIGCGGQGTHHLHILVDSSKSGRENIEVRGVCDIYEPRKERARGVAEGQAKVYHDYHELLDQKDLDAVWIATPDHWHSRQAIDAMEAGKDVYLEKPMTLYWWQAKQVHQAVLRTGQVLQVGSQGTQDKRWDVANDLIRKNALGKLIWSQSSLSRNSKDGEWNWSIDRDASPANLDWNAWLGPAPKRPFDPERYFRFRKFWDYSGGIATDLFAHVLHGLETALGPEFPSRVVAGGGIWEQPDREVPDTFHMIADFPSKHSVVVVGSMANEQGIETIVRGHEATMFLSGGSIVIKPERIFADEREEMSVPVPGVGDHILAHHHDFFECMRTRKQPVCHSELAYKVTVAIALAVASYRENKAKLFDPVKEEVIA